MEDNISIKKPVFKPALQSGVIMGFVLVIFSIVVYFAGVMTESYMQWIMFAIIIAGIFFFARNYREEVLGGNIKYGRALGFSVLMMLFAGAVSSVYTFVFYKFIDPSMLQRIVEMSEEKMYSQGLSDEQIEAAINMTKKIISPAYLSIMTLLQTVFISFIISLIVSLFVMKKDKNAIV